MKKALDDALRPTPLTGRRSCKLLLFSLMPPLPPPPRRIARIKSRFISRALARIVCFTVFALTLALTAALINELLLKWAGHDVMASVSSIHERHAFTGGYEHVAYYTYVGPGDARHADHTRVSWDVWHRLTRPRVTFEGLPDDIHFPPDAPASLAVRAYELGPMRYSRAVEHAWGWALLVVPAVLAPAGLLLSFTLYLAAFVRPRRHRRLYTHGTPITGRITHKNRMRSRYGYLHGVRYTYTPRPAAPPIAGGMLVCEKDFEAAAPDQPVTILFDPVKPERSTIYEYGGFRCV